MLLPPTADSLASRQVEPGSFGLATGQKSMPIVGPEPYSVETLIASRHASRRFEVMNEEVSWWPVTDEVDGASRLWVEYSDYFMACLRVLLEQVARLRT